MNKVGSTKPKKKGFLTLTALSESEEHSLLRPLVES